MIRSPRTIMVICSTPTDWHDLQKQVNLIFKECGLNSEIEKKIQTVRGTVSVDVFAEDLSSKPATTYLCECKQWQTAVPKTVVHAFRTVVADYGANWGFIISSVGFQSGAFEAAAKSAIRLLTWNEFQELFVDLWIETYMMPYLYKEVDVLIEYTEPVNSRIFRKANELNEHSQQLFIQLRKKYTDLAFLALLFLSQSIDQKRSKLYNLPLRNAVQNLKGTVMINLTDELLEATYLRDFLDIICKRAREGIAAFDRVFGGRV